MDKLRPESGFDYGDLPSDVADQLRRHAAEVRRNVANALPYLVEAGGELAKAKAKIHLHKQIGWERWCRAEAGVSKNHADRLIAVHRAFGKSHFQNAITVGFTAASNLARNPVALETIKMRALGGETITDEVVREVLRPSTPATPTPEHAPSPQPAYVLPAEPEQGDTEDIHGAYGTAANHNQRAYEAMLADVYSWRTAKFLKLDPRDVRAAVKGTDWDKEAGKIGEVVAWLKIFAEGV